MSRVSGKTFDAPLLRRVLNYVGPYMTIFYGTSFCAILIAFLSPTRPLLIQYAFDNFIINPDEKKLLHIHCCWCAYYSLKVFCNIFTPIGQIFWVKV